MIRPLIREDIQQFPQLHARVWGTCDQSLQELREVYQTVFPRLHLDHPWYDDSMPSLVHEEPDGRIAGMLAVMTRPMSFNGRLVKTAVSSQMCVDPDSRSNLAGVQLLKQFLNGPQDLSLADMANDTSRKVWQALGGRVAPLYSLHWVRPLRPCQFGLTMLQHRPKMKPLVKTASLFARLCDRLASRLPNNPFRMAASTLQSEPLTAELLLNRLPEFTKCEALAPIYDANSIDWIWERTDHLWETGQVNRIVVKNTSGNILGWYIYQLIPGGVGDVAQIVATDQSISDVLRHLFYHAWERGAVGLTGRMQPRFMQALSDQYCLFHRRSYVALVHSQNSKLLRAFEQGRVFLSHLEGEGCLGLYGSPTTPVATSTPVDVRQPDDETDVDRVQELVAQLAD